MCYICSCFSWSLDFFQRILTFLLSCWMMLAVCCGLFIAIAAGVAYGYNYCMAEFITLTRADVRVYMRRGQFYDRPDLINDHRGRRMGDVDDAFAQNLTSDYQDEYNNKDEPLSLKWSKHQDTRKYAEKLTKYSENRKGMSNYIFTAQPTTPKYLFTTPPTRRIFISPHPIFSTTVWHSGTSQLIMRQFEPINEIIPERDSFEKKHQNTKTENTFDEIERPTESISPDIRIIVEDNPKTNQLKMREWKPSPRPVIPDYVSEVDEDVIVYKAV